MFDHDADDDTKLCIDESIDKYQQLDTENHEYNKYNGNMVFVQRTFTFKEEVDAISRLQFRQLRANKVLIPQEYELCELLSRCEDINKIPSDTFFKHHSNSWHPSYIGLCPQDIGPVNWRRLGLSIPEENVLFVVFCAITPHP